MLWIAHYGGFGFYCWNPQNGKVLEKINLPVPNVTSCTFAGKYLDHLIITTEREGLSKSALSKYPESADVFYAKTKVRGVKQNYELFEIISAN